MYFSILCAVLLIPLGIAAPTTEPNQDCGGSADCFETPDYDVPTPSPFPAPAPSELQPDNQEGVFDGRSYVIDGDCLKDPNKCRICERIRQTICEEAGPTRDNAKLCSKKRPPNNTLCAYFTAFGLPPATFGVIPAERGNSEVKGYCPWTLGTCAICAAIVKYPQCWPGALQKDRNSTPTIVCTTEKPEMLCVEVDLDTIWQSHLQTRS